MMKFLPLLALIVMSTNAMALDYVDLVHSMRSLGMIDTSTLRHNIAIYNSILREVQFHATNTHEYHKDRRAGILKGVDDLNVRLDRQMGMMGAAFAAVFAPELKTTLQEAKDSANRYDYQSVLRLVNQAKIELNAMDTKE